ncbi:MAG: hypothetical protein K2X47_02625 [Bdellovibrionales bacterium]|nr:hypothetical protein [Bdellovibrionales bacterium]
MTRQLIGFTLPLFLSLASLADDCPKHLSMDVDDFIPIQIYSEDKELQTHGRNFRAQIAIESIYRSEKYQLISESKNAECSYSPASNTTPTAGTWIQFKSPRNELKMIAPLGGGFPENLVLELKVVINKVGLNGIEIEDERIDFEVRDTQTGNRVFIGHGVPLIHTPTAK